MFSHIHTYTLWQTHRHTYSYTHTYTHKHIRTHTRAHTHFDANTSDIKTMYSVMLSKSHEPINTFLSKLKLRFDSCDCIFTYCKYSPSCHINNLWNLMQREIIRFSAKETKFGLRKIKIKVSTIYSSLGRLTDISLECNVPHITQISLMAWLVHFELWVVVS